MAFATTHSILPLAWESIPMKKHRKQSFAYYCPEKWVSIAAGRGSGKTMIAQMRLVRELAVNTPYPNPIYFYLLPTYGQAKRVAWKSILPLIPPEWIARVSVSDLTVETVFGSTLYVAGTDRSERLEGVQWSGGIIDEMCDHRPEVFGTSLGPALTHRCRFCWRIGVPKRTGPSSAESYDFWLKGMKGAPNMRSFAWPSGDILSEEQLAHFREHWSKQDFDEAYNANWFTLSGGIYSSFHRERNVTEFAEYNPKMTIYVGCDFNVSPMSWTLMHYVAGRVLVFDEISIRDTTTVATLDELKSRYPNHVGWMFYGDAAAKHRTTETDITDYLLINNDGRFPNFGILFPDSNPALSTRFSTTNAALCNAKGVRRVLIHPRCEHLISDLINRSYKSGTRIPDDGKGETSIGHMTDSLDYALMHLCPIPIEVAQPQLLYPATSTSLMVT